MELNPIRCGTCGLLLGSYYDAWEQYTQDKESGAKVDNNTFFNNVDFYKIKGDAARQGKYNEQDIEDIAYKTYLPYRVYKDKNPNTSFIEFYSSEWGKDTTNKTTFKGCCKTNFLRRKIIQEDIYRLQVREPLLEEEIRSGRLSRVKTNVTTVDQINDAVQQGEVDYATMKILGEAVMNVNRRPVTKNLTIYEAK